MIASHYAEPVERTVASVTTLYAAPSARGAVVDGLHKGDRFLMLDDSLGWAWGYAGDDGHVGYIRSDVLAVS